MYREVTMLEVKEVLRLWRAACRRNGSPPSWGSIRRRSAGICVRRRRQACPATAGPVTDDEVREVLLALQPAGGRPRGDGWAACEAQRDGDSSAGSADGLRLTKIRKLLVRQGVAIAYPTLYRFAVLELQFGQTATTMPGARWRAWAGAAGRHRVGRLAHAAGAGEAAPVSRVDLHGGALAASLRLSDLRGDDGARHRGLRSGLGLLRRHLHRADPR